MAPRRPARVREAQLEFEALSVEGGLLSPEWLSKVAQLQAGMQSESDYRIPKGLNLRDEIGRYWRIAQAHWSEYLAGVRSSPNAEAVAQRFVVALCREVFGFSQLESVPPAVIHERIYPVGHSTLNGRVPVVIAPGEVGLDALSAEFGDGARRRSAFGLVQEYLNAAEGALWGICADGSSLRVLRDNASLTRPAWIEADLRRIFTEQRYSDFAALWLLIHETRFGRDGQPASECPLEAWRDAGREEGTRAREHLRDGVEEALLALGRGFLAHPGNIKLRSDLQDGTLSERDYFGELLRLVYRLIFLLTAEERGLLHPSGVSAEVQSLYSSGYSMRRLRERAVRRSAHDRYSDLWEAHKVVCRGLAAGEAGLGLPALAGIFSSSQCRSLDTSRLENRDLLAAVYRLGWLREDGSLSRVNWRDMGPEELGSVYESLLELVPQVSDGHRVFSFASGDETKGNSRKTSGSYYTPDALVQALLDSALEPVVADTAARNQKNAANALLQLAIIDPACGSGHFLLAAARRLAAHVARLRTEGTPSAAEYRHALREVVGRCIFGVDINPMAVELCKVALWMEAIEPGRPLTFLDSHIQCGNALLGTLPALMEAGVPDAAWQALDGDDGKIAAALRRRNQAEASGQRTLETLWAESSDDDADDSIVRAMVALDAASDTHLVDIDNKTAEWKRIQQSTEYMHQRFTADTWCCAFLWPKSTQDQAASAPTNATWRQVRDRQGTCPFALVQTVKQLSERFRLFHWSLQFPQVFSRGGFDIVLGNPPWENVELKEEEWFAERRPDIAKAPTASARKKLVAALSKSDPLIYAAFLAERRRFSCETHLIRESGRFALSARGRINTYAVFAELNRTLLRPGGRAGFITPAGLVTDDATKEFFGDLVRSRQLSAVYHFENEEKIFPGVHNAFRFALITIGDAPRADLVFFARRVGDLKEATKHVILTPDDLGLLNPNTGTCPTFRSKRDAELNVRIYKKVPVLWEERGQGANRWGLRFSQGLLNMAADSGLFLSRDSVLELSGVAPLYEGKMAWHFDHRFATYQGATQANLNKGTLPQSSEEQHRDPEYAVTPQYWVPKSEVDKRIPSNWSREWFLGWRDITGTEKQRTVVAAIVPTAAIVHTFPVMMPAVEPRLVACLYACLCSFVVDYTARQKVGGTHLTYAYLKQCPILGPDVFERTCAWAPNVSVADWIVPRVLELTYTSWDLEPFARDLGDTGAPCVWESSRRAQLRAELDAAFFLLYDVPLEDVEHISLS